MDGMGRRQGVPSHQLVPLFATWTHCRQNLCGRPFNLSLKEAFFFFF